MAERKLDYFKREILKHLSKLQKKEKAISKALTILETLQKAGYGIGTVRVWRGKKYKKIAQGKWRRIYEKNNEKGISRSINAIKKEVDKCENSQQLLNLVLMHKSWFLDSNGYPLPIVQELSEYASKKNDELEKQTDAKEKNLAEYQKKVDFTEKKRKTALKNQKAVKINTTDFSRLSEKECRELAKKKYSKLKSIEKDGRLIEFKPIGFKETKSHSVDKKVLYVLGKMDTLIKKAVFMYAEPNTDEKKTNTKQMLNYAVKTKIDGKEYYTRILIREDNDGNFYYDNESTSLEKVKANNDILLPSYQQTGFISESPYVDRISQWLSDVKFDKNNKHDKAPSDSVKEKINIREKDPRELTDDDIKNMSYADAVYFSNKIVNTQFPFPFESKERAHKIIQ